MKSDKEEIKQLKFRCFQVIAIALRFFLGGDREIAEDSDDETDNRKQLTAKDIIKRLA